MTIELTDKETLGRKRFCLAIDHVSKPQEALDIAGELSDFFAFVKTGSTVHTKACEEGMPIVRMLYKQGIESFLDLKFHDTPDQVYGSARAAVYPGVAMFNMHISSGEKACREAVRGVYDGAAERKIDRPLLIGVTELTSIDDAELAKQGLNVKFDDLVLRRAELAREWGLDGIVCPASKAGELEKRFGKWTYVTPGISHGGVQNVGQKQVTTVESVAQASQNAILVIGSALLGTKKDPKPRETWRPTAYEMLQIMAKYV